MMRIKIHSVPHKMTTEEVVLKEEFNITDGRATYNDFLVVFVDA